MHQAFSRLNVKGAALAGGALGFLVYVVCVLFGLALPAPAAMRQLMEAALPGFTWLTLASFLIGLVESFLYGTVGAGLAAAFYNYFALDLPHRQSAAR